MTKLYEKLAERPRTKINTGGLSYEERPELRQIKVTQSSDTTNKGSGGFATVYYLEGDARQAAEVFVEENQKALAAIDYSQRNIVQQGTTREEYDWILHYAGERELEKLDQVVYESRPDGTQWLIDRDHYEANPNRRYTVGIGRTVRIDGVPARELYESVGDQDEITESDLDEHDDVAGNVRYLLEYYRSADGFECTPVSVDGEMAIQKSE